MQLKSTSYSRQGRKLEFKQPNIDGQNLRGQENSPIIQGRDIAIKQIRDYADLLEQYGSSKILAQYLIVNQPKLNINNETNDKSIDQQSKFQQGQFEQLDRVRSFQRVLEHIDNKSNKKIDQQIALHLLELRKLFPSIENNEFYIEQRDLLINEQRLRQKQYQMRIMKKQKKLVTSKSFHNPKRSEESSSLKYSTIEDTPQRKEESPIKRIPNSGLKISIPQKLTIKFLQARRLINPNQEEVRLAKFSLDISSIKNLYKRITDTSQMSRVRQLLEQNQRQQQHLLPTLVRRKNKADMNDFSSSKLDLSTEIGLFKVMDQKYDESQKLTNICNDITRQFNNSPPPNPKVLNGEVLKASLYNLTSSYLQAIGKPNGKSKSQEKPRMNEQTKVPFEIRMNRQYPVQKITNRYEK